MQLILRKIAFKTVCIGLALLVLVCAAGAEGAGECGKSTTPEQEAMKLVPCVKAGQNANAPVSSSCCTQVQSLGHINPACLCAVMLSDTAKTAGIKPEIALTIPKRCNLANRPIGYKCGPYILP